MLPSFPYFDSGNIIISDIDRGFFIVRKSGTLSIDDSIFNKKEVSVYPNPANENVVISVQNSAIKKLQLFNVLGQAIIDSKVNNLSELNLDVSHFKEGIYFLKINNDITQKIIIKR